jgi:NAD(P)H-hydrate repair Nnr-like enzyme with NAD(P)H-hydrate dehydratase domain
MTGSSTFYGLLYLVNLQGSSGNVLSVQGNATVQGAVAIDGLGSASLGSSKTNLVYDQRAAGLLQGSAGAVINKSTWRELPSNTP